MNKFSKVSGLVGASYFVVFWSVYGLFLSTFRIFTAPESAWESVLQYCSVGLSLPGSLVFGWQHGQAIFMGSLLNSVIWGLAFGGAIYGIKHKFRRNAV